MTELEKLPTTDSGHVRKKHAMEWLDSLDEPTPRELKKTVIPKPSGFTGSKYSTEISEVRVTGAPEFVAAVAGFLKPLKDYEDDRTRVEINLQRIENRDTGVLTDNYALYLSIAERG